MSVTEQAPQDQAYRPVWARSAALRAQGSGEPSFKRLIVNLIVIGIVAAGMGFIAAPAVTFFGIRAAAEAGDVQGLTRLIDYDAVRASLRPQVSGRVEPLTPAPSILQDPLGAIRRQFEQVAPQPRGPQVAPVDDWLTPVALQALTAGAGRGALVVTPTSSRQRPPWPRPTYWSVNRARMTTGRDETRTVFTFERRGPYEWKLVHIGLPPVISVPAA